jgi:hypothetical protein
MDPDLLNKIEELHDNPKASLPVPKDASQGNSQ